MKRFLPYIILFFVCNSLSAQYTFNSWTAGSLNYTTSNMNVTITGNNFVNTTPRFDNSGDPHGASCAAAPAGLYISHDWSNVTSVTLITINFPTPVCGPITFSIFDINQDFWNDGSTDWFYFTDRVDISARDGAAASIPTANITVGGCGGNTVTAAGTTRTITGNRNNCLCQSNTVTIGTAATQISQITLRYYSGPATYNTNNPSTQYIVLSNFTIALPASPTVTAATVCPNTTASLNAAGPAGSTLHWFTAAVGGTNLGTGTNYVTPSLAATTTYYVEARSSCGTSARVPVTATVTSPAAPTAAGTTVCTGSAATVSATAPAGATFNWYSAASGGSSLNTGASYNTPVLGGTTTYYVDANNGTCTEPRTPVTITVTSPNSGTLVAGNESACDPSAISFSAMPSASSATSYTYSWYYQDGLQPCPSGGNLSGWTLINSTTPTQQTLFSDAFPTVGNPPPGGWVTTVVSDADNDMSIQVVTNPATPAVTGTMVIFNSSAGDNGDQLRLSRTVSTVGYTTISLTFDWYETSTGSADNVTVFYNTGSGWVSTGQIFNRVGGNSVWSNKTVSFGTYADNIAGFQIGFLFTNGTNNFAARNCYIDNVVLRGIPIPSYNPPGPLANNRTYAALVTANGGACNGAALWSAQCRQVTMACLLPLEWLSFEAEKIENTKSLLTWTTAMEEGNAYFDVERSKDGVDFVKIGTVQAQNNEHNSYEWTDATPLIGDNYYRLRQVDLDGQQSYSSIKQLYFDKAASWVNIYPNPTRSGEVAVQLEAAASVTVWNVLGQCLQTYQLNAGSNSLSFESAGVYLLKIQAENLETKTIRLVVEQ